MVLIFNELISKILVDLEEQLFLEHMFDLVYYFVIVHKIYLFKRFSDFFYTNNDHFLHYVRV
jgi:hypothetical protein